MCFMQDLALAPDGGRERERERERERWMEDQGCSPSASSRCGLRKA